MKTVLRSSPAFLTVLKILAVLRSTPTSEASAQDQCLLISFRSLKVSRGVVLRNGGLSRMSASLNERDWGSGALRNRFRSLGSGSGFLLPPLHLPGRLPRA